MSLRILPLVHCDSYEGLDAAKNFYKRSLNIKWASNFSKYIYTFFHAFNAITTYFSFLTISLNFLKSKHFLLLRLYSIWIYKRIWRFVLVNSMLTRNEVETIYFPMGFKLKLKQ